MKPVINLTFLMIISIMLASTTASAQRERITENTDPDTEFSTMDDLEAEIKFGRDLAARILGNYKLVDDPQTTLYVNKVGKALSLYSGRPEVKFYFSVLDTNEVNAFATPGGYIFITKGALVNMDNEAQLAGVLAHEIAHVSRRHVVKRLNIKATSTSSVSALSGMIGGNTAAFRNVLEASLNKASDILFKKGYMVEEELEADNLGTLIASSAGYYPSALKVFLTKTKGFEQTEVTKQKKEHPDLQQRLKSLDKVLVHNGLADITHAKVRRRFHENIKR